MSRPVYFCKVKDTSTCVYIVSRSRLFSNKLLQLTVCEVKNLKHQVSNYKANNWTHVNIGHALHQTLTCTWTLFLLFIESGEIYIWKWGQYVNWFTSRHQKYIANINFYLLIEYKKFLMLRKIMFGKKMIFSEAIYLLHLYVIHLNWTWSYYLFRKISEDLSGLLDLQVQKNIFLEDFKLSSVLEC